MLWRMMELCSQTGVKSGLEHLVYLSHSVPLSLWISQNRLSCSLILRSTFLGTMILLLLLLIKNVLQLKRIAVWFITSKHALVFIRCITLVKQGDLVIIRNIKENFGRLSGFYLYLDVFIYSQNY